MCLQDCAVSAKLGWALGLGERTSTAVIIIAVDLQDFSQMRKRRRKPHSGGETIYAAERGVFTAWVSFLFCSLCVVILVLRGVDIQKATQVFGKFATSHIENLHIGSIAVIGRKGLDEDYVFIFILIVFVVKSSSVWDFVERKGPRALRAARVSRSDQCIGGV